MPSPTRQDRLDDLDALLRADGLDVYEVAKRWNVHHDRVRYYLTALRNAGAQIKVEYLGPGKRVYSYAEKRRVRK